MFTCIGIVRHAAYHGKHGDDIELEVAEEMHRNERLFDVTKDLCVPWWSAFGGSCAFLAIEHTV